MSRIATDWAWKTSLPAAQKLLLLSLADRADEEHCCFPSIKRLVNDTGLDRKTVQKWVNIMIEKGLIFDTGERRGKTKSVRVLRLNIDYESTEKESYPKNGTPSKQAASNPNNGTAQKPSDPNFGHEAIPKTGRLSDPKFGTLNLTIESVIESKNITPSAEAQSGEEMTASRYAFEGSVIKLNHADFAKWKNLFSSIDLSYELQRLDLELSHDKPKNWFATVSAKLNYQNKQAKNQRFAKPARPSVAERFSEKNYGETDMPDWARD